MFKLNFFVPATHLESVKAALFEVGAGRIGNYDCCSWETLGQGQFRPLSGSKPFLGTTGKVEVVAEYKVEMVCKDGLIEQLITALKNTHPYEEPAFDVIKLESF